MGSTSIAVVPGPRTSFLDHLIPFCHLLEMPLHCSDDWVETCAAHFYPKTEIVTGDLTGYDTFFVAEPCRLHQKAVQFGSTLYNGDFTTYAGFHGNPDKFRDLFWIERYLDEDVLLIYGQQLIDYFKEKGIWTRLKRTVTIGNLRYAFYKAHQAFFDGVAAPHLPKKRGKTLLWAPTWSFTNTVDDSPFFDLYSTIFASIPKAYQLIVKLHPYMFRLFPERVAKIKEAYPEIHFLDELPLVYPFLNQVDLFLGDYSSIAYDFLTFDRPLFFLGEKRVNWGVTIENPKRLFQELERPDTLRAVRQSAYIYAYGQDIELEEIKRRL